MQCENNVKTADVAVQAMPSDFLENNEENKESKNNSLNSKIPAEYLSCLSEHFGHQSFRKLQWKIVKGIVEEKIDIVAVIHNGYGKSVAYQFPAIYLNKVAVVISPFFSVMESKVKVFNIGRERACLLDVVKFSEDMVQRILNLDFNLVYVTLERITDDAGLKLLRDLGDNLILIVVNEAHCISQFGHEFLPEFRKLSSLRKTVPKVPILALTAIATANTRDDIWKQLGLHQPLQLCSVMNGLNLDLIVRPKSTNTDRIVGIWHDVGVYVRWAVKSPGSVYIYTNTARAAEEVCAAVKDYGIFCRTYHSNLTSPERETSHYLCTHDFVRVIVSTMTFGVDINKPDLRLVIHYGAPNDIESYYQQIGRAGRDGQLAKCVLFYSAEDWATHNCLRDYSQVRSLHNVHLETLMHNMIQYTRLNTCRHHFLANYFGATNVTPAKREIACCDNCRYQTPLVDYCEMYEDLGSDGYVDVTDDADLLLDILRDLDGQFVLKKAICILQGTFSLETPIEYYSHPLFGKGDLKKEPYYKLIADHLVSQGYITFINRNSSYGDFSVMNTSVKGNLWLSAAEDKREHIKVKANPELFKYLKPKSLMPLEKMNLPKTDEAWEILKELLSVRLKVSKDMNILPKVFASNDVLAQLALKKPLTMSALKLCKLDGYYDGKYERFGPAIIECIVKGQKAADEARKKAIAESKKKPKVYWEPGDPPVDGGYGCWKTVYSTLSPSSKPTSPSSKPTSPSSKPTSPSSKPASPSSSGIGIVSMEQTENTDVASSSQENSPKTQEHDLIDLEEINHQERLEARRREVYTLPRRCGQFRYIDSSDDEHSGNETDSNDAKATKVPRLPKNTPPQE